ncbi:MAG: YcxB family protein [Roseburia sp.]|nr:YcxB family protein [Roseburia sp.]
MQIARTVMTVAFDIRPQAKDLYRFNIHKTYTGLHGWVSIILAVLSFVMAAATFGQTEALYTVLYLFCGVLFLCYLPVALWRSANRIIQTNEILSGTVHYELSEEGIRLAQGEETGELLWSEVYKMTADAKLVLIYVNRQNAYIIPREQLGGKYQDLKALAEQQLEPFRVKFRD